MKIIVCTLCVLLSGCQILGHGWLGTHKAALAAMIQDSHKQVAKEL